MTKALRRSAPDATAADEAPGVVTVPSKKAVTPRSERVASSDGAAPVDTDAERHAGAETEAETEAVTEAVTDTTAVPTTGAAPDERVHTKADVDAGQSSSDGVGSAQRSPSIGEFIREQRRMSRLSVRRLSEMAQVSNPYLSQIERGLRRPSADILQQLAKALRISAETLYIQAGILDEREPAGDLARAIWAEPTLTQTQKQALVQILGSFQHENAQTINSGLRR